MHVGSSSMTAACSGPCFWCDTSLHTLECGLQFYSWCWKSTLCCEPHPGSCTDLCNTSWSVWFTWVSLSLVNWAGILFSFPSSLKQGSWWYFLFYWFTLWLSNFWPYQCILLLTLYLALQRTGTFQSHKCRLNFQNFSGQNNVNKWKLHFRLPPVLGWCVNWNEQSWKCLNTFLFWLQNKANCALYTVFSLINTWNNLLAITLYFSSCFKDVCYFTYFGLEILSISTGFSGDCNVFWFLF